MTHHPNKEQIIERMKKTQKEQISKMTKEERQEKWGQLGEKKWYVRKNSYRRS